MGNEETPCNMQRRRDLSGNGQAKLARVQCFDLFAEQAGFQAGGCLASLSLGGQINRSAMVWFPLQL